MKFILCVAEGKELETENPAEFCDYIHELQQEEFRMNDIVYDLDTLIINMY